MANNEKNEKKEAARQAKLQQDKERRYAAATRKLGPFAVIALVITVLALLLLCVPFAEIYNSDIAGVEVGVSGFNFLAAAVTGNYSSADSLYGDIAVPFYYYAPAQTQQLATAVLILAVCLLLTVLAHVLTAALKKPQLLPLCAALSLIAAGLTVWCFFIRAGMTGSDILPIYCSSNPACSIRAFSMVPAAAALCACAVDVIGSVKLLQAKKLLK